MPRPSKQPRPTSLPPKVDPADVPLTIEERLFVENMVIDGNRTRAYREVFPNHGSYHSTAAAASRMARRPNVAREIRASREAIIRKFRLSQDQVIEELMRIAFADLIYTVDANNELLPIRRIPFSLRRAISSVDVLRVRTTVTCNGKTRTTQSEKVIRYKLWSKMDALDRLANYLGFLGKTNAPRKILSRGVQSTRLYRNSVADHSAPLEEHSSNFCRDVGESIFEADCDQALGFPVLCEDWRLVAYRRSAAHLDFSLCLQRSPSTEKYTRR